MQILKFLFWGIGIASFIVILLGALLFIFQRKILYPAPDYIEPPIIPSELEKIDLEEGYGFYLNAARKSDDIRPVMIFMHGNAELAYQWTGAFDELLQHGISVLSLEYPGYGGSVGSTSYASIERTVIEAYDALLLRTDVDKTAIFAYGRSIGGGAAALLADKRPLVALCFESTFSSMGDLVAEKGYPRFLLRERYENEEIIAQLDIPVFIFHGSNDRLIPLHHAKALAKSAQNATLIIQSCGHNDCSRPWPQLIEFIKTKTAINIYSR